MVKAMDIGVVGRIVFILGVGFWLGESVAFGWHALPQSIAEQRCDLASTFMLGAGLFVGWKFERR